MLRFMEVITNWFLEPKILKKERMAMNLFSKNLKGEMNQIHQLILKMSALPKKVFSVVSQKTFFTKMLSEEGRHL